MGQGEHVIDGMAVYPSWGMDLDGEVNVVPAHGKEPGEYLAKLGRVYMDREIPWTARLELMLSQLEERYDPSIVLLESRSGLHDIAAATVTDLDAQVLLFAINSDSHWTDYDILFRHWQTHGLASRIRERLSVVSGLTPELETKRYLQRFRERAWELFMDHLYDDVDPADHSAGDYSFDIFEEGAPHDPIPIHWTRGLAGDASLHDLERTTVEQSYTQFLARFDELTGNDRAARFPVSAAIDVQQAREALSNLPEGTSHGETPAVNQVYLPRSHLKAMHPDTLLVTGMRGLRKNLLVERPSG